jgi:hypothetical protein
MNIDQLMQVLGLQRAYQSYQQNIGEPFAAIAGGIGRGYLGLDKPQYGGLLAEDMYRTGQALGSMPGIGAPAGAFSVGAKAAAQVPSLLADAVQMMKANPEAGLLALTGYHGSPYRFSKFDASKIGSGEGAQSFGYGLYFAESPSTAGQYKMSTAVDKYETSVGPFRSSDLVEALVANSGQVQPQLQSAYMAKANEVVRDLIMGSSADEIAKSIRDSKYARTYAGLANAVEKLSPAKATGKMYTVDIPDDMIGKMLDWDKPLSQQAPAVRKAIDDIVISEELYKGKYASRFLDSRTTAGEAVQIFNEALGGPNVASQYLRDAGIPGIRYLDQQSRGTGKGTSNFVVFPGEEEAVRILNVE